MNGGTGSRGGPSGSALLFCLVLLLAFTLLGVALASDFRLQSRIQSNVERNTLAEMSAEAALTLAERWLFSLEPDQRPVACALDCGPAQPVWSASAIPGNPGQAEFDWWRTHAQPAGANGYRLIVEIDVPGEHLDRLEHETAWYRVLALGTDPMQVASAVTESVLIRPWPAEIEPDPLAPEPGAERFCRRAGIEPCGRVAWRRLR